MGGEDRIWYCAEFNKHEGCSFKGEKHTVMVNGMARMAHHICASCYVNKKEKREHSAVSCKNE